MRISKKSCTFAPEKDTIMEKKYYIQPEMKAETLKSLPIMQLVLGSGSALEPGKQNNGGGAPMHRTPVF